MSVLLRPELLITLVLHDKCFFFHIIGMYALLAPHA